MEENGSYDGLGSWGVEGASTGGWRKGPWSPEEDKLLSEHVKLHGEGRWSSVSKSAGLSRTGKSCRLRWVNYLRPGLKRGQLTPQEEGIIIELHALWGNKWSTIARYLPGRTDNEIKNYWRTHFKKKEIKTCPKQDRRRSKIPKQKRKLEEVLVQGDQEDDDHTVVMKKVNDIITDGEMMRDDDDDAQGKQEDMVLNNMCHTSEDQCLQPMMYSQLESAYSWANTSLLMEDDWLWGGLWNLYALDDHDHL